MMLEVTNQNEMNTMKNQFDKVFKSTDPFGEMFNDSIEHRLILCPVDRYRFDRDQYRALMNAIKAEGENFFFITETEFIDCFNIVESPYIQPRNWRCLVQLSFDDYDDNWFYLENSIYSPTGKWGGMISHEDHAVIGGSKLFIDTFKLFYPNWSKCYVNFIEMWQWNKNNLNSNTSWIEGFLKHVNR